jgi:hypothetical protein
MIRGQKYAYRVQSRIGLEKKDAFAKRREGLRCSRSLSGLPDSVLASTPQVFDDNGVDFSVLPDWFTQGFDTLDLKEAKELLEQLNA